MWRLSRRGELEDLQVIDLGRASYIHDFTATDRELVILLQPWVRDRMQVPLAAAMSWKPELGTRVLVLDKNDLTKRRTYELPPFFFFHLGDAWREADGTIRFDGCIAEDGAGITADIGQITSGKVFTRDPAKAAMFALHPDGRGEVIQSNRPAEFPKGDPRFAGLARRYTWHVTGPSSDHPLSQGVAVTDWNAGRTDRHLLGRHQVSEEGVFVPRPGSTAEGDGWVLASSLNLKAKATELHVFDARRIADGPLCTWRGHAAMPVGFHGTFVRA